jgi:hypothetical protein
MPMVIPSLQMSIYSACVQQGARVRCSRLGIGDVVVTVMISGAISCPRGLTLVLVGRMHAYARYTHII